MVTSGKFETQSNKYTEYSLPFNHHHEHPKAVTVILWAPSGGNIVCNNTWPPLSLCYCPIVVWQTKNIGLRYTVVDLLICRRVKAKFKKIHIRGFLCRSMAVFCKWVFMSGSRCEVHLSYSA